MNKLTLTLLFVLTLVVSLNATGLFRPADYNQTVNVSRNFTIKMNESDYVAKISYNFTPLINLGLVSSSCGGFILSNNTVFNSTHSWYTNFWIEDCNLKTINSTIHIREESWGNQIAPVWTIYAGNLTALAGGNFQNASGVYTPVTYAFVALYNSTSVGGSYTDIANDLVSGVKTNTIPISNLPYSTGVAWGSSDFVTWTQNALYRLTSNFTYAGWVKPETNGNYVMFLTQGESAGAGGVELRKENTDKLCLEGATMGSLCSSGTMTNDSLYFVAGANNGASSAVYMNTTKTTGNLNSPSFAQNNPLCTGGQSYATACHAFATGAATQLMIIKRAISDRFVEAEVNGYDIYSPLVIGQITVVLPSNTNYTTFTIPYNFTPIVSTVNVTVNSSSCGSVTIKNALVGTYYSGNLTCTNRKNQYFLFNVTDNTFATLQTVNQSFYIYMGATFNLTNGGNGTDLTSWTLNITNGTFTTNFTGANNPFNVEVDSMPLGNPLYYNFTPSDNHYVFPDVRNLNGQFNSSNNTFQNFTGKAWLRQDFYLTNGSLQQNWTLNVSWSNGTSQSYVVTNFNQSFSLEQFTGQNMVLNGLLFGFGNQSLQQVFNGSSPYLNYTFSVTVAGLNISVYQELNQFTINSTYSITNGTKTYINTTVNNSGQQWFFVNYTLLPLGVDTIQINASGYYNRNYVLTLDAYTISNLQANLPLITTYVNLIRFHILSPNGNPDTTATVVIQRFTNGNWVTVGSAHVDGTGVAAFYMDSTQTYQVMASDITGASITTQIIPVNPDVTLFLGSNSGNFSYVFQNVSLAFAPPVGILTQDSLFNCSFNSADGRLIYYGMIINYKNQTNASYSQLYTTNVTGSPNGGSTNLNVLINNRTNLQLTCFFKVATFAEYDLINNYTVISVPSPNNFIGGLNDLGNVANGSGGFSIFLHLMVIIGGLILAWLVGGGNATTGLVIFSGVIFVSTLAGFFNIFIAVGIGLLEAVFLFRTAG